MVAIPLYQKHSVPELWAGLPPEIKAKQMRYLVSRRRFFRTRRL
jgi:hypothetical protein